MEGIKYPSKNDWKNVMSSSLTNVLFAKRVKIYPAYISKHKLNNEKQVIHLMIQNGEGWHYIAVKNYLYY